MLINAHYTSTYPICITCICTLYLVSLTAVTQDTCTCIMYVDLINNSLDIVIVQYDIHMYKYYSTYMYMYIGLVNRRSPPPIMQYM